MEPIDAFHELSYYTLAHPDRERFVHQHVVDAFTAQTAGPDTKPIGLLYALAGLYLAVEQGYSGREVQRVHMELAKDKTDFPPLTPPPSRGSITVDEVLAALPGPQRDAKILEWCASVWAAYAASQATIAAYCRRRGISS